MPREIIAMHRSMAMLCQRHAVNDVSMWQPSRSPRLNLAPRAQVMHYFEFSPFFDRTSNNSVARRRDLEPAVPGVLE